MYMVSMAAIASILLGGVVAESGFVPRTAVTVDGANFRINRELTYGGLKPEASGKLMNVRMVNCIFDDENPKTRPEGFDAEKNTTRFISSMDQYKAKGILAFTINLQGGFPGYEGAINTAFRSDGSLKPDYMKRVSRVIEAADKRSMVIILGFFYQRQDQILPGPDAIRKATANAAEWIRNKGYANVIVEIANEYSHGGFADSIRSPNAQVELIGIVHSVAPDLLVSTSGMGDCSLRDGICNAADYILIHGNGCNPDVYGKKVESLKKYAKPIVFNEDWCFSDDPRGVADAPQKARAAFEAGASWGIMNEKRNQQYPFVFGIGDPTKGGNDKEDFIAYETIAQLVGLE